MVTVSDIQKLTRSQRLVLGRIAFDEDTNCYPPRTIKALVAKKLIVAHECISHGIRMTMYATPMDTHIAYCQWCAMNDVTIED